MAKMFPAKRIKTETGKVTTITLSAPIEYYVPTTEEVVEHLSKADSLLLNDDKDAQEWSEQNDLPAYADEFTAWIVQAMNSAAQVKTRGAFKVEGESAEELKVEITGTVPQSREDLLATARTGGPYMEQKAAFLKVFAPWITANAKKSKKFLAALGRSSLAATPREGWPVIERAIEAFVKTLEDETPYKVYLRSIRNQLQAEDEAEDWDSDDLMA